MSQERFSHDEHAHEILYDDLMLELLGGKRKKRIVRELVSQGWARTSAKEVVAAAAQKAKEVERMLGGEKLAMKAQVDLKVGLIFLGVGLALVVLTYLLSSPNPGRGRFIPASAALVLGLMKFCGGLLGRLKYGAPAREEYEEGLPEFICSECGHDIEIGHKHCPHCGSEIDWRHTIWNKGDLSSSE